MKFKKAIMISMVAVSCISFFPNKSEASLGLFGKFQEKIGMGPQRHIPRNEIGQAKILANHQRYQIIDLKCSYSKAKIEAEMRGGHLAIIDSAYENKLLYDFMVSQGYEGAYFGIIDKNFDGNWKTIRGEKPNYTNWHKEQPARDNANKKYAMLYRIYTKGKWKAGTCSKLDEVKGGTAFIIEWDKVYDEKIQTYNPQEHLVDDKNDNTRAEQVYIYVETKPVEDVISDTTEAVSTSEPVNTNYEYEDVLS